MPSVASEAFATAEGSLDYQAQAKGLASTTRTGKRYRLLKIAIGGAEQDDLHSPVAAAHEAVLRSNVGVDQISVAQPTTSRIEFCKRDEQGLSAEHLEFRQIFKNGRLSGVGPLVTGEARNFPAVKAWIALRSSDASHTILFTHSTFFANLNGYRVSYEDLILLPHETTGTEGLGETGIGSEKRGRVDEENQMIDKRRRTRWTNINTLDDRTISDVFRLAPPPLRAAFLEAGIPLCGVFTRPIPFCPISRRCPIDNCYPSPALLKLQRQASTNSPARNQLYLHPITHSLIDLAFARCTAVENLSFLGHSHVFQLRCFLNSASLSRFPFLIGNPSGGISSDCSGDLVLEELFGHRSSLSSSKGHHDPPNFKPHEPLSEGLRCLVNVNLTGAGSTWTLITLSHKPWKYFGCTSGQVARIRDLTDVHFVAVARTPGGPRVRSALQCHLALCTSSGSCSVPDVSLGSRDGIGKRIFLITSSGNDRAFVPTTTEYITASGKQVLTLLHTASNVILEPLL
ncbi:uncharacterized protein LACBIDRAFT_326690 [Laccaria bicolor S238N-H82]|uniref:Predicted protein n=1 Tax=Laccaria bicolor (strain S238N-H82 / ATCC MYA-4686) TaxID=486041 RepID=B0D856_LACBS|nr:uncharacterized protein LACBIDRAFT_326690 [Laccaria bicolor S238N-H82]EDR09019.1 predicted protein [Laccaria bicolor S238N-H82]|eukprot:XP_001880332.1 predicted protein [Laccaria bicolor S238N-H82]